MPEPLKAVLVDLIARGVSARLVRQQIEDQQSRTQNLFDQFFGRRLAEQIRKQPDILRVRPTTVTILFCDIRRFSSASERLGADKTQVWMRDVLGKLSECVFAEDGVVVNYIGDEIMALWGAPTEQPDQTERAVRAGLAMIDALAELNARWGNDLGEPMDLGVGINRGEVQVGNVGSNHKFQFGVIGHAVNVASRAQGMTKHLKCRLLVTEAARRLLGSGFAARRVVCTRLANLDKPVNLYEVAEASADAGAFFAASEAALQALEDGEFRPAEFAAACRLAADELNKTPADGPLLLTLARAAEALMRGGRGFAKEWTPPGK